MYRKPDLLGRWTGDRGANLAIRMAHREQESGVTAMKALALDMGGSHIGCGVVEGDQLLAHSSIDCGASARLGNLLPSVTHNLRTLLHEVGAAGPWAGITIGFPGIVDARNGRILSTLKKYEDAPDMDFNLWARSEFDLVLRIENDARMAVLGEHYAGAGRNIKNLVMMTLGTGIGSGVILNGHLLRGVHAHAGCFGGHLNVKFDGRRCHCGNIGCAEAEASGWSMPQIARDWPGFTQSSLKDVTQLGFRELFAHAQRGDIVACQLWERCLHVWAANAVSLIHAYDPEVLLLGGGVMQNAEPVLSFVQDYVNKHTWSSWGNTTVCSAALGNSAALLGAIPLLTEVMHEAVI
jgi:glucokinase